MVEITKRIRSGQGDFVLFAITPPRQSTPAERLPEIAHATVERLDHLDLDGLALYDIDDERSRNPVERPFPFTPTVDPSEYRAEHLQSWRTPAIVYRAVGKYQREELRTWLTEQDPRRTLTVLVGAASSGTTPPVSLADARRERGTLLGRLGGVRRQGCPWFHASDRTVLPSANDANPVGSDHRQRGRGTRHERTSTSRSLRDYQARTRDDGPASGRVG